MFLHGLAVPHLLIAHKTVEELLRHAVVPSLFVLLFILLFLFTASLLLVIDIVFLLLPIALGTFVTIVVVLVVIFDNGLLLLFSRLLFEPLSVVFIVRLRFAIFIVVISPIVTNPGVYYRAPSASAATSAILSIFWIYMCFKYDFATLLVELWLGYTRNYLRGF